MRGLVARYLSFGTEGRPEDQHRRIMALNLIVAMTMLTGLSYGVFCLLYDFDGLWPMASTYGVAIVILALTFPILRKNAVLAAYWWAIMITGVLVVLAYLTGRSSGFHLYLLSGPGIILTLYGADRIKEGIALSVVQAVLVLVAQFLFVDPAPFMRVGPELEVGFMILAITGTVVFAFIPVFDAMRRAGRAESLLAKEHERSRSLLENLLPTVVADRLIFAPEEVIADDVDSMSILFADIVGFTPRAANRPAKDVVVLLNRIFSEFDALTEASGLEKIKTIGDAYMVAAGVPEPRSDHAAAIADLALAMCEAATRLSAELGEDVDIRLGAHTGPAVAGVIGTRKVFYDVWGDTVNTAARNESHGEAGRIQVSRELRDALEPAFVLEKRGIVEIKGKGPTETWWLVGRRA